MAPTALAVQSDLPVRPELRNKTASRKFTTPKFEKAKLLRNWRVSV